VVAADGTAVRIRGVDRAPGRRSLARTARRVRARGARGASRIETLAEEASRTWNLPLADCRRYLEKECLYEPGAKLRPALLAFRDAAAALGLCDGTLAPEPIALPVAHVA
jgi:predicted solute-binding protein